MDERYAFILVAGVIATHCIVVLVGVGFCFVHPDLEARCNDMRGQLLEALTAALAAALAFGGGRR
jgi:hypothetical protein